MGRTTAWEWRPERPHNATARVRVVACTLIRNQAARVRGWVRFYQYQGISQFTIYDDASTDGPRLRAAFSGLPTRLVLCNRSLHCPTDRSAKNHTAPCQRAAFADYMRRKIGLKQTF